MSATDMNTNEKGKSVAKYYVSSNDFRSVVIAETPREAAVKAFDRDLDKYRGELAPVVRVSEIGFETYLEEDHFYNTVRILSELGIAQYYL